MMMKSIAGIACCEFVMLEPDPISGPETIFERLFLLFGDLVQRINNYY